MIYSCVQYGLLLFISAIGAFVIFFSLRTHRSHVKFSHIPGPKRQSFFLGNVPDIQELRNKRGYTMPFSEILHIWRKQFGPLFVLYLIHKPLLICSDATAIKEILTRNTKYPKPNDTFGNFKKVFGVRAMGRGLFSETDHEVWSRRRAMYNHAFHRQYLIGLMSQFNSASDHFVQHLMKFADGRVEVTMTKEFSRLTLHVISKIAFGLDLDVITNPENRLCQLVAILLEGIQTDLRRPFLKFSPRPMDRQYKRKVREAIQELRKLGRTCIESRLQSMKRGEDVPPDILTHILSMSDTMQGTTIEGMEGMLDDFITFFVAGQETTSNLLAFTLLHLGQNPDVMRRLVQEVDTVFTGKDFIEYSDIAKLQYMSLVLKEALRINPPAGMTWRELPIEREICGYKVPKGSCVVIPIFAMGHHEKHFKNPEMFDPDRFIREQDKPLFAYIPFSLGARSCIGQVFAMIEAKVILSKLLQSFTFRLLPGQSTMATEEITMKPVDGCRNFIAFRERC